MNKDPLVTVLLITYNHVNTFERAIKSVLSQNVNFAYRVVVYDDCSTDGTSEIVKKYLNYPNVDCVIRQNNVGGMNNLYEAISSVRTKYFCVLETDDYWCDDNKLQTQVDILEANSNCSFCAHNTLIDYVEHNKQAYYLDAKSGIFAFPDKISHNKYIEPHISSRLYRTEALNLDEISDKIIPTYDIASNFYYLTKGDLFYIDKVMSVYNVTGRGIYSSLSSYEQAYKTATVINKLNAEFKYKYNYLLASFFVKRLNLTYFRYLQLRYFTSGSMLSLLYSKILHCYYKNYVAKRRRKCLLRVALPISKKKRICFEVTREKEIV